MKNLKNLILVRHADYDQDDGHDPKLSSTGVFQSRGLALAIKKVIGREKTTIWSSSAVRAKETAEIIQQEMNPAELIIEEKLWSDKKHRHDFDWLKQRLEEFEGENLIIVSHLEYVRLFPLMLGYDDNNAGYAGGVLIRNGQCEDFN
jgi:phosphohistidine phosphatase SixA